MPLEYLKSFAQTGLSEAVAHMRSNLRARGKPVRDRAVASQRPLFGNTSQPRHGFRIAKHEAFGTDRGQQLKPAMQKAQLVLSKHRQRTLPVGRGGADEAARLGLSERFALVFDSPGNQVESPRANIVGDVERIDVAVQVGRAGEIRNPQLYV